jgi:integrase
MEESAYRRYIDPLLGHIPLHRLTPEVITRAYDEISRSVSPSSVRRLHQQLSSILHWAEKRGYVSRAETERVDVPRASRVLPTAPTLEDVTALLSSAEHDDDLWLMIRLASSFGLRRGEIAGLRIRDVDFDIGSIRINKSVTALSGQRPKVVPPKTGEIGSAVYRMDDELLTELISRRAQLRSIALETGVPLDELFIFTGNNPGEPRRPDYFTRKLAIHRAKNPDLAPVILKALRNFTGSELAEDEVDLMTSKTVLRHTDHNTTARHYVAPRERKVRQATVRLGQKLGGRTKTA